MVKSERLVLNERDDMRNAQIALRLLLLLLLQLVMVPSPLTFIELPGVINKKPDQFNRTFC